VPRRCPIYSLHGPEYLSRQQIGMCVLNDSRNVIDVNSQFIRCKSIKVGQKRPQDVHATPFPSNSINILFPAPPDGTRSYGFSTIRLDINLLIPPLDVSSPLCFGKTIVGERVSYSIRGIDWPLAYVCNPLPTIGRILNVQHMRRITLTHCTSRPCSLNRPHPPVR